MYAKLFEGLVLSMRAWPIVNGNRYDYTVYMSACACVCSLAYAALHCDWQWFLYITHPQPKEIKKKCTYLTFSLSPSSWRVLCLCACSIKSGGKIRSTKLWQLTSKLLFHSRFMSVRSQFFSFFLSFALSLSVCVHVLSFNGLGSLCQRERRWREREVERMMGSRALNWIAPLAIYLYAGNLWVAYEILCEFSSVFSVRTSIRIGRCRFCYTAIAAIAR